MVVFTVIFGKLGKLPSDGASYALLVFAGMLPWTFFSTALADASGAIPSAGPKAAGLLKYGGTYPGAYLLRRAVFMPWELESIQSGFAEKVRFVGHVAADELPDYYRLADAFVMPSTGEGFGIAFLEAMASGVPVIGGNKDGSLDPLADGQAGTAVDPNDSATLASAICSALRCPAFIPERTYRFSETAFCCHLQELVDSLIAADRWSTVS
jgi:glycosyltransferase involved in cell wall biosynthesis